MQTEPEEKTKVVLQSLLTPVNEYVFRLQLELSSACADSSPATPRPMAHINSVIYREMCRNFIDSLNYS
jgi:hypothetical protein